MAEINTQSHAMPWFIISSALVAHYPLAKSRKLNLARDLLNVLTRKGTHRVHMVASLAFKALDQLSKMGSVMIFGRSRGTQRRRSEIKQKDNIKVKVRGSQRVRLGRPIGTKALSVRSAPNYLVSQGAPWPYDVACARQFRT